MLRTLRNWVIVTMVTALPLAAYAETWFFNTQARSAGGTINSPNMTGQRSTDGSIFKSYTTSAAVPVTISADPGFYIRDVTVNSVSRGSQGTFYSTSVQGGGAQQSVTATFTPSSLSVTATPGNGGSFFPSNYSNITYGYTLPNSVVFYVTPKVGYFVQGLTGVPAGVTVSPSVPAAVGQRVTVTFPKGYVFTAPVAMNATFASNKPIITVASPQLGLVGVPITLTATHTAGPAPTTYTWSQASGPATATLTPSQNQAVVVAPVTGFYLFRVSVDGGMYCLVAVNVSDSIVKAARNLCQFCHQANGIGSAGLFQDWSSSQHRPNRISCQNCHTVHPSLPAGNVCVNCHYSGGNTSGHPVTIAAGVICTTCHNAHTLIAPVAAQAPEGLPHYNNMTSAGYPASYVSSRSDCSNCHNDGSANSTDRLQWWDSGHASVSDVPWASLDFKTMSGCVQCHTTTGFIAYSTGSNTAAWGSSSDKTKEVLTCIGCHSDVANGVVRSVKLVRPYAADSFVNHDLGESNVCAGCHSGTSNGASIAKQVGQANFADLAFVDSHYLAAAGTFQARGGYHYAGQSYASYSTNSHALIGVGNRSGTGSAGPCVACHKTSGSGHSFGASASTVCANCHGASLPQPVLDSKKGDYVNALSVLRAALAAKGFVYYSTATPRFSNRNWGGGQAGADTMGAAFNYALLRSEPGGYAHNAAYSKKLIADSIDYLYNGSITGSISSALTGLVSSGAISQDSADRLTAYTAAGTSCTSCHNPAVTGSHPAHLAQGFSCAECHSATTTDGTSLVPGNVTHLNGRVDVMFFPQNSLNGKGTFNNSLNSCSAVTCHGNGTQTVTWGSGPVTCESCHTGALSVIDGVTAPDKSLAATAGHGSIGEQCLSCHDTTKQHLGGNGMLQGPLTGGLNAECSYCHSDPDQVGGSALNMSTHFAVDGTVSATCSSCHDPHGTTNVSMLRSNILGKTVVVSDTVYGLVNTSTNQGFCQVCHTTTNHYRAGQPETNHFTSGCLNCHSHNNPTGAFRPVGTTCDSCHGYPPAPRRTSRIVTFGIQGNWSSARFEDYSGGGGAHLVAKHISPSARPSDGWVNCTICHNGGRTDSAPYHQMLTPVSTHINNVHIEVAPKFRLDDSFTIYTSAKQVNPPDRNATGSCFNISCHFKPSPRWGLER